MPIASRVQTAAALALLTVASIGSARATVPVNYGTTELGQILSTCFYVCFGSNCSAPGTVSSIAVNPPFLVRGIRIAESESPNPCDPDRSLTWANLTLPRSVGAGQALVKIVNACSYNDRYWVFSAATTNVEYTLTVTDTESQVVKTYFNPMGSPAPAVTDTSAFATCP